MAMVSMASHSKEENTKTGNRSQALTLALISVSAALYAVAVAATSFVPTPWGIGNFRPGVVIPAFFAVVFGPFVGGMGAALGCFIGDLALTIFGLSNPLLSIVAGVPGNFVGFYLLGWLASKRRSVQFFILSSFAALVVGNLIAALGVLGYFWLITFDWALSPVEFKIAITVGLMLFWVLTMVIFVVPLVPVLVLYIAPSLRKSGISGISNLKWGKPMGIAKSSSIVALILAGIYVLIPYIPYGELVFSSAGLPQWLLLLASAIVFLSGLVLAYIAKMFENTLS